MAANQPHQGINLARTATPVQAAYDLELCEITQEEGRLTARIEHLRSTSGYHEFCRFKIEQDFLDYQQDCLRVEHHACKRRMGLHIVPKGEPKKWVPYPDWVWDEKCLGYHLDVDCNIIGGDGNPLVCENCDGSKMSRKRPSITYPRFVKTSAPVSR